MWLQVDRTDYPKYLAAGYWKVNGWREKEWEALKDLRQQYNRDVASLDENVAQGARQRLIQAYNNHPLLLPPCEFLTDEMVEEPRIKEELQRLVGVCVPCCNVCRLSRQCQT